MGLSFDSRKGHDDFVFETGLSLESTQSHFAGTGALS